MSGSEIVLLAGSLLGAVVVTGLLWRRGGVGRAAVVPGTLAATLLLQALSRTAGYRPDIPDVPVVPVLLLGLLLLLAGSWMRLRRGTKVMSAWIAVAGLWAVTLGILQLFRPTS